MRRAVRGIDGCGKYRYLELVSIIMYLVSGLVLIFRV